MTDLRRRVSMLAAGAASLALLTNPLAALAQDEAAMASVSEACQAADLGRHPQEPGPPDAEHGQPRLPALVGWRPEHPV